MLQKVAAEVFRSFLEHCADCSFHDSEARGQKGATEKISDTLYLAGAVSDPKTILHQTKNSNGGMAKCLKAGFYIRNSY